MRKLLFALLSVPLLVAGWSCANEVADVNENVYSFTAVALSASEGEDVPVRLAFGDAGLNVDNASWGDPWKKAVFHGEVTDETGRQLDYVLFSGPDGVLVDGSQVDISDSRMMDIAISGLRKGRYTLRVNMETRYTVNTWATATFTVGEATGGGGGSQGGGDDEKNVLVEDFTVPGKDNGLEINPIGDIILDLRVFNEENPFRFLSTVSPSNATDKRLGAEPSVPAVVSAAVEGESLIVLTPKTVGRSEVTVRSLDKNVTKTFGVTVILSDILPEGFTLPTDEGEGADYDLAGRLMLDINDFVLPGKKELDPEKEYTYVCRPYPDEAANLSLKASSDNEAVLEAAIRNGHTLVLHPKSVGYAVVTVSTTDDAIVRQMRVAVVSRITVSLDVEEGEQSEEDKKSGVFPCRISVKPSSHHIPMPFHLEMYGRATGRVDLTDKNDYFLVDTLKNSRSAIYSFEEKVLIMCVPSGAAGYDVYKRLMSKIAGRTVGVHHGDDWPNYYDYTAHFRLYSVTLSPMFVEDYDTNLYRVTVQKNYDKAVYRIYQYLH